MPAPRRSVLAVAVLSMLSEAPMHAYRMQQLIKERHKDDVINVSQRNSVYQTIQRLLRDGLVEVEGVERAENRPERTTYRITAAGRELLLDWLRDMLAEPVEEFPQFPAALSFLPSLDVEEAVSVLGVRLTRLRERIQAVRGDIDYGKTFLAPVFLVETVYQERLLQAELQYVEELVADLKSGRVTWPARTE
ncbi:PadR family transcriptional regulator [Kineosporia babensis]|uniref:PadR family transcriptional regulator n=1 Tax=Kineosporia babensis TaxID=499548 RepID=A0A9X1NEE5_9ACTN|nr:PadR family transcriptional regulator [Kineosporia babensis]